DMLFPVAFELRTSAPHAAYELLLHIVTSEGRRGYRYPSGNRCGTVVMLLWMTLNHASLFDKREEAYTIGLGYSLVNNANIAFNLGGVGCGLGRREAALAHVARALALESPKPQQIHDDNDLEALRGDPAFEQLFVDDAARRADKDKPKPKKKPK